MAVRLALRSVSAGYLNTPVVHDISFEVHEGEVVGLLGPNGAGKTTTLLTAAGVLRPSAGSVWWNGDSKWIPLHRRARTGLGFVAEERSVFMSMTTSENLRMGRGGIQRVVELFPELESRMNVRAGLLSGGEQQMLALGRALAARPAVLLVDELSLGLAPLAADRLLASLRRAVDEDGTAVVLVEQNLMKAIGIADTAHVIRRGRIRESASGSELRSRPRDEVVSQLLGNWELERTTTES